MEINDGGSGAAEFSSQDRNENYECSDNEKSESEDSDSDLHQDGSDYNVSQAEDQEGLISENDDVNEGRQKRIKSKVVRVDNNRSNKRQSIEEKLEQMSSTLEVMKEFFLSQNAKTTPTKGEGKSKNSTGKHFTQNTNSDTTIYKNALDSGINVTENIDDDPEITFKVQQQPDDEFNKSAHRNSSSSEDRIDTSDELMEVDVNINEQFIADYRAEAEAARDRAREQTNEIIREAEASKARIFNPPGMLNNIPNEGQSKYKVNEAGRAGKVISEQALTAAVMDQNYTMVGNNLEPNLQEKIKKGEYVDFARLIPRDRVSTGEDHRMECINKGGQTFFVPVADREVAGSINGFSKWEQAFRIYSNVYLMANPSRATELIQYNHTIGTAASSYSLENVYSYDKEFRMYMQQFPSRNWLIILQQAWTMILKDCIKYSDNNHRAGNSS